MEKLYLDYKELIFFSMLSIVLSQVLTGRVKQKKKMLSENAEKVGGKNLVINK